MTGVAAAAAVIVAVVLGVRVVQQDGRIDDLNAVLSQDAIDRPRIEPEQCKVLLQLRDVGT